MKRRGFNEIQILQKQPYYISLNGLDILVDKNVFPTDQRFTSEYLAVKIQRIARETKINSALDMGTGTGYLAMIMKQSGIKRVVASDNHEPSIECARKNFLSNGLDIELSKSDLFQNIPKEQFDLIVFNQPFIPYRENSFGQGDKGGFKILEEFFITGAKNYMQRAIIMVSYTKDLGRSNDPMFCQGRKFYPEKNIQPINKPEFYVMPESEVTKIKDENGRHRIYTFTIKHGD